LLQFNDNFEHALTKATESIKRAYIARGAVSAERKTSNPMNLIRVMPAKGSGCSVPGVPGTKNGHKPLSRS